jgi:anaerobic selenocysteine-containing dehydrogenase
MSPKDFVAMGLQLSPYSASQGSEQTISMETLQANLSGVDLGELKPQLPERLNTKDKQINCAVPQTMADLGRLQAEFSEANSDQLRLIGRRHVRSNNSWMHNFHRLVKGKDRCTLLMHPCDITAQKLKDGSAVMLASRAGSVQVKLEASDAVMPGVVSLPHGYGHNRDGIRMATAVANAGVSCNDVTDELYLDALSGNAAVNGVPVTVTAI